jgi:ribosomal protein S1
MAKATSMAELMAKANSGVRSFKKGEIVKGTITKLTPHEILVDIGAKTEASVLEKDKALLNSLLAGLKVGDSVNISVLNPESDQGNPVVSLRRFMDERQWGSLDKLRIEETPIEVMVNDITKGGFLVQSDAGYSGFLPNSQMILNDNPQTFVGKKIKAVILELNRPLHKIIFSQKAAITEEDFGKLTNKVSVGEKLDTLVTSTTPFGVFVSIPNEPDTALEGFIHLSEITWERVESVEGLYKVGDKISAQVLGVDKDAKRVNLSIKRLSEDPFGKTAKEFPVDKKVKGTVSKIASIGVTVDLGGGAEGLIKKEKLPPSSSYSTGDEFEVTVSDIDEKRHFIILSPVLNEKPIGYR